MSTSKLLTYDDWYEGKVYLNTCPAVYPANVKFELGAALSTFDDASQVKIKKKQKEIFDNLAKEICNKFKSVFNTNLENSSEKKLCIKLNKDKCLQILTGDIIPGSDKFEWKRWATAYTKADLIEIRYYYHNTFVKGQVKNHEFIHSKNFKFQRNKIPNEIYAQGLYDFLQWLKTIEKSKDIDRGKIRNSHLSIAIAYHILGIPITIDNAKETLARYSFNISYKKLVEYYNNNIKILKQSTGNKSADTKYYNTLIAAQEIISGEKNAKALDLIKRAIVEFDQVRIK